MILTSMLFILVIFNLNRIIVTIDYCTENDYEIICNNFTLFEQLNFTGLNYNKTIITIKPIKPIELNDTNLILPDSNSAFISSINKTIILRNINGFSSYLPNLLLFKNFALDLDESEFKFTDNNLTK